MNAILKPGLDPLAPHLSIVIPAYNAAHVITATLKTITPQLLPDDELLVVDDASTDNTINMASAQGADVIRLEQNSGPATARTRGAEAASGEVIVFTDTDVWLPEDALDKIRDAFMDPEVNALQGIFSEECPHPGFFSQYKNLYNRFVLRNLPDRIDTTYTSLTAVRREAFFKSGGFDLNIRGASVEDRTLGMNLVRAGYEIILRRDIEVVHNKALTFGGFLRNQYRRSRDLMKLGLRSRGQRKKAEKGRYGTNTRRAMLRIPVAYGFMVLALAALGLVFTADYNTGTIYMGLMRIAAIAIASLVFALFFLILAGDFLFFLMRRKGLAFAIRAFDVNFLDALICGAGIFMGALEYFLFKRRY